MIQMYAANNPKNHDLMVWLAKQYRRSALGQSVKQVTYDFRSPSVEIEHKDGISVSATYDSVLSTDNTSICFGASTSIDTDCFLIVEGLVNDLINDRDFIGIKVHVDPFYRSVCLTKFSYLEYSLKVIEELHQYIKLIENKNKINYFYK